MNRIIARPVEKELVKRIGIGTDLLRILDTMRVLKNGGLFRE